MSEDWGETAMGSGSIPASAGSSASDPGALIASLTGQGQSAAQMQALATRASIPVPGGSGQEMPASLMYQPKTYTPAPTQHGPTVGKGSGRAQGIGNTIVGVLNTIGAVKTGEDNKKKLQIATDTHTLLTEQNNIDQANQAMAALPPDSPQRKQLQDAIDASKQRMNGVLSDKKTATAIAKGFHIDFTDPQANNTDEHQGVQQGQKMAEKTLADQFMQKAPAPMGPNQTAVAQYNAAVQQQTLQMNTMKAFLPLVKSMMDNNARMDRDTYVQGMENARNMITAQTKWDTTMAQIQGRKDLANTQFGYKMREISAEGSKQFDVFKAEYDLKKGDPAAQIKAYTDYEMKSAITKTKAAQAVTDAESAKQAYLAAANKGHMGSNNGDPQVIKDLDDQINLAKAVQTDYNDRVEKEQKYYNQLAGVKEGGTPSGNSSTDNSLRESGINSSSTYLTPPDDPEDDDSDDPDPN